MRSDPFTKKVVLLRGKTQTVGEWCRELNIDRGLVYARVRREGWPIREALQMPKGTRGARE